MERVETTIEIVVQCKLLTEKCNWQKLNTWCGEYYLHQELKIARNIFIYVTTISTRMDSFYFESISHTPPPNLFPLYSLCPPLNHIQYTLCYIVSRCAAFSANSCKCALNKKHSNVTVVRWMRTISPAGPTHHCGTDSFTDQSFVSLAVYRLLVIPVPDSLLPNITTAYFTHEHHVQ